MKFNNSKIALIIGGTSGMGLATAKQLAALDIEVVVVGNNQSKLDNAVTELNTLGKASGIQANLYNQQSLQKVLDYAAQASNNIGYLVNAAGYFNPKPFLEHTQATTRFTWA